MDDLWALASIDVEAENRHLAQHRASAALEDLWPFLALSRSQAELEHRKALAMEGIRSIAETSGMPLPELGEMIDRRFALLVEASLYKKAEEEEGGQEFYVVDRNTGAKVAGPFDDREKAQEAIAENDSGLPSSELTIEVESIEPEEEEEGEGKEASRRHALMEGENILAETVSQVPGVGQPEKPVEHDGQVPSQPGEGAGTPPEGPEAPGEMTGPPAATSFPETTKPRQMPDGASPDPMQDAMSDPAEDSEDDEDPVGDKVDKVAATVREHNPHLDEATCRRVARKVVGRYLTAAGDDGINYVGGTPKPEDEEEDKAHPGETAAAGMVGRTLLRELPLLAV